MLDNILTACICWIISLQRAYILIMLDNILYSVHRLVVFVQCHCVNLEIYGTVCHRWIVHIYPSYRASGIPSFASLAQQQGMGSGGGQSTG